MDPLTAFQAEARDALQAAARTLGHEGDLTFETPPDPSLGDLACPCFPLARSLRKAPQAIATDLAGAMETEGLAWVARVEARGPYVNVFLDAARVAQAVLDDPGAACTAEPLGRRVLIEHTSANPNGPLHVGRARNPILGDTLVRLHRAAGYDVDAHYYMDNLGRQVALLYWGHENIDEADLPAAARDKTDHRLVRFYQEANDRMQSDPAIAQEIKDLVARLETADEALLTKVRGVYEACFAGMTESLERLGVHFDAIDDESDHVQDGTVDKVIQDLKKSGRHGDDDGAHYLDLAAELKGSKSTKFFFTRADGTSVYATRDVAYHKWKADTVGDGTLIDVLGEDHRLQSLQVSIALDELGASRPEVVFYAFVSLPEGKMSTRANRVVFLDDLLDEAHERAYSEVKKRRDDLDEDALRGIAEAVGMAAVRFNIARIQPEKPIRFRWEEALSFDGDSAPYIQYAHARAASLMRMAEEAGLHAAPGPLGEGEVALLAEVARLPWTAREAADRRAPQIFAQYATRLASAFNDYYRDHPVVSCEDRDLAATRLATVAAARLALERVHDALGLPVLASM